MLCILGILGALLFLVIAVPYRYYISAEKYGSMGVRAGVTWFLRSLRAEADYFHELNVRLYLFGFLIYDMKRKVKKEDIEELLNVDLDALDDYEEFFGEDSEEELMGEDGPEETTGEASDGSSDGTAGEDAETLAEETVEAEDAGEDEDAEEAEETEQAGDAGEPKGAEEAKKAEKAIKTEKAEGTQKRENKRRKPSFFEWLEDKLVALSDLLELLPERVDDFIDRVLDKADEWIGIYHYYENFLFGSRGQWVWEFGTRHLLGIWHGVQPRMFDADVSFHHEEDLYVSKAMQLYAMLIPVLDSMPGEQFVDIQYGEPLVEGKLGIRGYVSLPPVLYHGISMYLSKDFRSYLRRLKEKK